MKRTIPALLFAGLIIAAMASCTKEEDTKPSTGNTTATTSTTSTTSSTSATSGASNPLITKECTGTADITVNDTTDTLSAMEAILPPLKMYGIYTSGVSHSLTLQTGAKSLPAVNTTFTIVPDQDKIPKATEMMLNYYDDKDEKDYFAVSGTVSYTISTNAKTVKFSNITFKSEDGATKTISFEVHLK